MESPVGFDEDAFDLAGWQCINDSKALDALRRLRLLYMNTLRDKVDFTERRQANKAISHYLAFVEKTVMF